MGRGDKRTKRGKIAMGSFGKTRLARTPGLKPATAATTATTEGATAEGESTAAAARPRKKKSEE